MSVAQVSCEETAITGQKECVALASKNPNKYAGIFTTCMNKKFPNGIYSAIKTCIGNIRRTQDETGKICRNNAFNKYTFCLRNS